MFGDDELAAVRLPALDELGDLFERVELMRMPTFREMVEPKDEGLVNGILTSPSPKDQLLSESCRRLHHRA
jgi:hypothetical protein